MSKQPLRANGGPTKRLAEDGDICPVCKSSRYLNPNMKFKVNPECYHKMCESCVARIFDHGPAPCPIAGCARTLRRANFKTQTFEDLKVEREVDIRKRVMNAMNKVEDDFETLRDYNDYLEQVEEITWNLILNIDVEATESRLRRWEEHQRAELHPGVVRRVPEPVPTDHVVLKKGAGAAQRKAPATVSGMSPDNARAKEENDKGFTFHGLKKRVVPPKEAPFDPLSGWEITPQHYVLQDQYEVDWFTTFKNDPSHVIAGWDLKDYANRTLREAFGGLTMFIEEEINARNLPSVNTEAMKEVTMDDVF